MNIKEITPEEWVGWVIVVPIIMLILFVDLRPSPQKLVSYQACSVYKGEIYYHEALGTKDYHKESCEKVEAEAKAYRDQDEIDFKDFCKSGNQKTYFEFKRCKELNIK